MQVKDMRICEANSIHLHATGMRASRMSLHNYLSQGANYLLQGASPIHDQLAAFD
jgi:hypothetical protein